MKSKNYLEMHNTPKLKSLLKIGKENNEVILEILKSRKNNFFNDVTNAVQYYNN